LKLKKIKNFLALIKSRVLKESGENMQDANCVKIEFADTKGEKVRGGGCTCLALEKKGGILPWLVAGE